ncbi:hypothetical protein N665_0339s0067 [Sinapis alba]|nr:hypothetical protein N665_0339s0067 [Sinapis alba]
MFFDSPNCYIAMDLGPGIPRKCQCGSLPIILTSRTKGNPGCKFYRCGSVSDDNHLFKWADEAQLEELDVLAAKQVMMEKELMEMKEVILEFKKDISKVVVVVDSLRSMLIK